MIDDECHRYALLGTIGCNKHLLAGNGRLDVIDDKCDVRNRLTNSGSGQSGSNLIHSTPYGLSKYPDAYILYSGL